MEVFFNPTQVPRNTSKEVWKQSWRELRVMRRQVQDRNEMLRGLLPSMSQTQKQDVIDELTFPPLLLGPLMGMK